MKGFTLIELLVVIGIIVILMTAALVAINPFKQFAMANNANRWSGVTTTMNAISQRMVDKKGILGYDSDPLAANTDCPGVGDDVPVTTATNMGSADYDICTALVTDNYMGTMPYDPQNGKWKDCSDYDTDYTIVCDTTTKRITVCAPNAQSPETSTSVCITR
jgi:prepilin-type N-terminal cleavage/methylation domain-containing protein